MKKLIQFIKNEIVLVVSLLAAVVTMFFVPPSADYIGYINFSVISLLFCLMLVVSGVMETNLFGVVSERMLFVTKSERAVTIVLVAVTFFSSMLITNDVALITFVPLTISIFGSDRKDRLILTVVLETIAANLGSMATPVGNPQNLYIYDYFSLSIGEFFKILMPVVALSMVMITVACFTGKNNAMRGDDNIDNKIKDKKKLALYIILFVVCMMTVLRVLDYRITLGIVALSAVIFDRKIFKKVDYFLLLTFVAFFIFVGNLRAIPEINSALGEMINGREFIFSVMASQIISNVPATAMLSGFTDNAAALLMGVDVGGLGTPVASLASLISMKLYSRSKNSDMKKYLLVFTVMNVIFLGIFILFCIFVLGYR